MLLTIDNTSARPVYQQIVDSVREQVASGALKPRDVLPSVRELARDLEINVNTAHKAYQVLREMKMILIRPARGAIIAPTAKEALGSSENLLRLRELIEETLREAKRLGFDKEAVRNLILNVNEE